MKIEKCPFCGGEGCIQEHVFVGYTSTFGVVCLDCCAETRQFFNTKDEAISAWNRRTQPEITGETSDGYHTFNELYHHRAVLFSVICNDRPTQAWKSKLHHDGTMYDGMFIVGIETPDGQATYHYDIEPYWEMFNVQELPQAPEWDGHTPAQAIERIGKLRTQPENEPLTLEELREMDGEPLKHWVWVKVLLPETWPYEMDSGYYRNILDFSDGEAFCCGYPGWITGLPYSDYGKTWLAYRVRPEGSTK